MMKRIGGIIEGLILQAIGAYAGALVIFGDYWRFLNPKFKWLTGATAAMLLLTGTVALFNPNKRFKVSRILIFLLFLRIFTVGITGSISFVNFLSGFSHKEQTEENSRSILNGLEYVKINLVELSLLGEKPESDEMATRYVVRGIVRRSQELDRSGQFALMRVSIFCCLADAVATGFRVQYDRPDEFTDGQWVEMYGTVKPLPRKLPEPHLHTQGMLLTILYDSHLLVPDKILQIEEPQIPFMFEFRKEEPYAY
jgi:hypothetical protein